MTGSLLQEQCAGMLICWIHHVRETQFLGQFQPVWERLHSHHICSHGTALLCRAKSNRTQTSDENHIPPRDVRTKTGRIGGAAPAGNHSSIQIGQFIREGNQVTFFSQEKIGMASVSLPPIGSTLRAGATNHPATTAIMAQAAATDVIDDHAITLLETLHTRANALDNATRLVADNDATVCLGTRSPVAGPVDGAQVTPTERRGLHAHQHLAVSRLWNGKLPQFESPVSQKNDSCHRCHTV